MGNVLFVCKEVVCAWIKWSLLIFDQGHCVMQMYYEPLIEKICLSASVRLWFS